MNIKEIIDKERWEKNYHNAALDRIEANVTEYVAELEAAVNMYKQSLKTQTAYTDNATKAAMVLKDDAEQRIAELETRLEKAEANYRFMVERAANERLDGYRELGRRAADAENERDEKIRRIAELEEALDVRDMQLSDISSACESAGCLYDEAMDEFIFKQKQRIAELEAQVAVGKEFIENRSVE